jgi:hypothetical protein
MATRSGGEVGERSGAGIVARRDDQLGEADDRSLAEMGPGQGGESFGDGYPSWPGLFLHGRDRVWAGARTMAEFDRAVLVRKLVVGGAGLAPIPDMPGARIRLTTLGMPAEVIDVSIH